MDKYGCQWIIKVVVLTAVIWFLVFGGLNALGIISSPSALIIPTAFAGLNVLLNLIQFFFNPRTNPVYNTFGEQFPPTSRKPTHYVLNFGMALVLVVLPFSTLFVAYYTQNIVCTPSPTANGVGVSISQNNLFNGVWDSASHGICIGISIGNFAFDVGPGRLDSDLKRQAATKTRSGDIGGAKTLWEAAIKQDPGDAEAKIYLEDLKVLLEPHFTLVVGTMLTGNSYAYGRDDLQGAYIAQKEHNDNCTSPVCLKLYLLIANSGGDPGDTSLVAQQIIHAAKSDSTIVGVMGWPFSPRTISAVNVLAPASIPMVSPTASSDSLTGMSPFFFRASPSNMQQAIVGAQYVKRQFHASRIAVFYDVEDDYSKNLGVDFMQQFLARSIVTTEIYTVSKPAALPDLLQDALKHNPDLIYFSGYANDVSTLIAHLPTTGPFANLQVMGGDALYSVHDYTSDIRPGFHRLHFTAFAYPDEWKIQGHQQPAFFDEYTAAFDDHQHQQSPYGYSRADADVMLSYDATKVLLEGVSIAQSEGIRNVTPQDLQQALTQVNGKRTWQGVSGQITFGADGGDPLNKAIVVLYVDTNNHIQAYKVLGCFFAGKHCS